MKPYAFYLSPSELNFFAGIFREIPPDLLDIHIGYTTGEKVNFNAWPPKMAALLVDLADSGYTFVPQDMNRLPAYKGVAISAMYFSKHQKTIKWEKTAALPNLVKLVHSVDWQTVADPWSSGSIVAHKRLAAAKEPDKVCKDENPDLWKKLREMPRESLYEYAYTGPYHIGEWAKDRYLPRTELVGRLEEYLQKSLPSGKPIVAFLEDEISDLPPLRRALSCLASHATLIVKADQLGRVPGAIVWPDGGYAPNLLRFAADYILAGFNSGTLASSTMLGLRVIPYCTTNIYIGARIPQNMTHFSARMSGRYEGLNINPQILDILNPPANVSENRYQLLERMNDETFWRGYEERLPAAQNEIFDDYTIDDAPALTAKLLLSSFFKKSFGEHTAALELKPAKP